MRRESCRVPHAMLLPINFARRCVTKPTGRMVFAVLQRGRGVGIKEGQIGWRETGERQSDWGHVGRNLSHRGRADVASLTSRMRAF